MGDNGDASIVMFLKRPSHHPMSLVTCRRVAAKTIFQMRQFYIENIQQGLLEGGHISVKASGNQYSF